MTTTSPGWYDDGHGSIRWWDGANWTDHVALPDPGQQPSQPTAIPVPPVAAAHTDAAHSPPDPVEQPPAVTTPLAPVGEAPAGYPPYAPGGHPAAGGYAAGGYAAGGGYAASDGFVPPGGYVAPGAYAAPGGGGAPGGYAASGGERAPDAGSYGAVPPMPKPGGSKLWIVWVVLGVIALAVVILLAVLTPILISGFTSASDASGAPSSEESSEPSVEESSEAPAEGAPTAADQQAAAAAVQQYNDAWITGDCDVYMATTTEGLRTAMEVSSCETFALASRDFALGLDGYQTTIGDIETVGNTVTVSTTESYTSLYDDEGNPTAEALPYEDQYEYIVVRSDGAWVINDFYEE